MTENIRNAMYDSCDECGKQVVYEKDDDSGLVGVDTPEGFKELCEKCYAAHLEREASYREDLEEGEIETFERPDEADLVDVGEADGQE